VRSQAELYQALAGEVDDELSWSESELPEHQRTKHVHRLHPYLGKFVPQLVEVFLRRLFEPGMRVLDPFAGSGTTLVECSTFGAHCTGVDVSAFNVLLARVKTAAHDVDGLERDLAEALARLEAAPGAVEGGTPYLERWYAPRALSELLAYRALLPGYPASADAMRVLLSRAARSARLTAHHDLDFPSRPQTGPYACRKHRRTCAPTDQAAKFLRRYTQDTARRARAYAAQRQDVEVHVLHADARKAGVGGPFDGIITSPPYPGRIDYHEQHRYAFELLDLPDLREVEIGAAAQGTSRAAIAAYVEDMAAVFANARTALRPGSPVVVVIDDARGLYQEILERAGLELQERRRRHVNRRTGRRAGEFFEDILIARA
jgi:hypothetical protein